MKKNNPKTNMLGSELEYLQSAKEIVEQHKKYHGNELLPHFDQLVQNYEGLIKLAVELFRNSDRQRQIMKRQKAEIRIVHEELQQLEASRRQLLTEISHELGTPMTSIQGYLMAMLDNVIAADAKYLKMILNKTEFINQLVEDLFEMSKLESGQVKMDLEPIAVDELFVLFRYKFELEIRDRGYFFVMVPVKGMPERMRAVLHVDTVRIEQVMYNLISNAFKYTPPEGTITFQCEVDIEHSLCTFMVTDSGPGIEESSLANVFDRFYRGNKLKQSQAPAGTGLGLSIAREIIKKHEGEMGVKSKPGEGASFYFSLPLTLMK